MRVLPGVVGARRQCRLAAAVAAVVAVVTVAALTGCSQFDAALGQRQAVVSFRPGTLQQLTFRVDHASNADIAQLERCLAKFPAVVGITLQDSTDMGG